MAGLARNHRDRDGVENESEKMIRGGEMKEKEWKNK